MKDKETRFEVRERLESQKEKILLEYSKGRSINDLASEYAVNYRTMIKYLHEFGCEMRPWKRYRKVANEKSFSDLNNPQVQYWLGYLAGDGNVSGISVSLSSIDKEHIYKFREFLQADYNVSTRKRSNGTVIHQLKVRSERITHDLASVGIVPRKSKILRIENNSVLHSSHFIRGIIDSDGYISVTKNGTVVIGIATGSGEFAQQIQDSIAFNWGYKPPKYKRVRNWSAEYEVKIRQKEHCRNILFDLYIDAPIFLERKRDAAIHGLGVLQ